MLEWNHHQKSQRDDARQSLGDTNQLPHHTLFYIGLQTVGSPQVNGAAEQFFKIILQGEQTKIPHRAIEFHKQIHIAGRNRFISCHRAKQQQRFHTELGCQFGVFLLQGLKNGFLFHVVIITLNQHRVSSVEPLLMLKRNHHQKSQRDDALTDQDPGRLPGAKIGIHWKGV